MKECLLSGLLSVAGKKVLHLDRNSYYGGASASLDIGQLFAKFGIEEKPGAPDHEHLIQLPPLLCIAAYTTAQMRRRLGSYVTTASISFRSS